MISSLSLSLTHTGGTRGGQDQFKWEDVKNDKYRENYLGHSVLAPVGRWQKGKDLTWYAKSKAEQATALEEERRRIKELDEDLLNAALGVKAKKKWTGGAALDADDLKHLLARGSTSEFRSAAGEEEADEPTERVKGLGAAPAKFHEHIDRKSNVERELEKYRSGSGNGNDNNNSDTVVGGEQLTISRGGKVIVPSSSSSAPRTSAEDADAQKRRKRSRSSEDSSSDESSVERERKTKREHKKREKKEKKDKEKKKRDKDHKKHRK